MKPRNACPEGSRRPHFARIALLAGLLTIASPSAQAVEGYIAGESGWQAGSAGTGLVALRTSLRISRDTASSPGTLLAICSTSDDRILFDPSPTSGIRSAEPSATGTASIGFDRDGGSVLLTSMKLFPNGSFELSDLPPGGRNVARSLIAGVANGDTRVSLRLNPVMEARFEKERRAAVQFRVSKQDRAILAQFETSCRLLRRAS